MKSVSEYALPIIRKTRGILLPFWGNADIIHQKSAAPADVVTKLDREIETYLSEELRKADSSIGFVGEEFGGERGAERFWLCDPIDGTAHFIRGLPFCTVMLALIEEGQVNFSIVYDFINDIVYRAERGTGTYKNDIRLFVSDRPIADAYLGYETHLNKSKNMKRFLRLREKGALFRSVNAGWEFAMVAEGKLEGRISFDPWGKDYDFAPGSLLVSEAGGIVANLGKATYDYRNLDFIASNKFVFKALTEGKDAIFPIT